MYKTLQIRSSACVCTKCTSSFTIRNCIAITHARCIALDVSVWLVLLITWCNWKWRRKKKSEKFESTSKCKLQMAANWFCCFCFLCLFFFVVSVRASCSRVEVLERKGQHGCPYAVSLSVCVVHKEAASVDLILPIMNLYFLLFH